MAIDSQAIYRKNKNLPIPLSRNHLFSFKQKLKPMVIASQPVFRYQR